MTGQQIWTGQCHCGAVRFEVQTDLEGLADCNCSRCRRLGWVMKSVPAERFTLVSGDDRLADYRFNTKTIAHQFCSDCGIESFARGEDDKGNRLVMINVNCLEGAPDIDQSKVHHWDGRNF
jgi:hypothetical protein